MEHFPKSHRLENVRYEIRGPVLQEAMKMEEAGHQIIKLNIGNPAPFGFEAPDEIVMDIIRNLPTSQGYCDSKGLYSARKAIVQYYQSHGIRNLDVNDVYIGNGVSELILMTMQALLNDGDEILIPAPDYPLWTAAATLSGGNVRHYLCDESSDWFPDIADIKAKITEKTKAIVIINPNNPTGAVYSQAVLEEIAEIARQHNLMIFADEIYEKIVYDGAIHHHMAAVAPDVFCVTFNGLSKAYRVAGFRQGWMILTGNKKAAPGFIDPFFHAALRQHPHAARHPSRIGRLPKHRRAYRSRRAALRPKHHRRRNAQRHRRRKLRAPQRLALRFPQAGHSKIQHPRRRAICPRFSRAGKSAHRARHGLQLDTPRPLPRGYLAAPKPNRRSD